MSRHNKQKRLDQIRKMQEESKLLLNLHQPAQSVLHLPFKPFTREEVESITGAPSALIDILWGHILPEQTGDVGFLPGLNWMQCFAVFVASRWLHEGSGGERAIGIAIFVANLGHDVMIQEFEQGNDMPAPSPQGGILVPHPDSPLGNRLNLRVLNDEFRHRLDQLFSKKVQVSGGSS